MPGLLAFIRGIGRTEIPPENEPLAPWATEQNRNRRPQGTGARRRLQRSA